MMHYSCLSLYKSQNFENRSKLMLSDDLDINNFSCPLCKKYSNTLIPPVKEMENLDAITFQGIKDQDKEQLLSNMLLDLFNIMSEKSVPKALHKEILIKDIPIKKADFIKKGVWFVNHCLQLTDVKGLSWTLKEKPKIKTFIHT